MIEEILKIHDRYQFEIKQAYKYDKDKKSTTYDIETYLFIPKSLDINRRTYANNDFYNNMKTYLRFKTPVVFLRDITAGNNSPIEQVKSCINKLTGQDDKNILSDYEYHIKMFCCILKSALRDYVFKLTKDKTGELKKPIDDYLKYINEITSGYRNLFSQEMHKEESFRLIHSFGDEYMSLLIESHTYKILELLKASDFKDKAVKQKLLELVRNEIGYRRNNKYPSIPGEKAGNEELIIRFNILKKYMENILFLNTRTEPEGKIFEQVIFGIAAGVAMIFATLILFFSQQKYGSLSIPFFAAIVAGYIFKDRIKEFLRVYLSGKTRHLLFDYKTDIYSAEKYKIGFCEESFDFTKEYKLPQMIRQMRNKDIISEIDNGSSGEKIILYRRHVKIFSEQFKRFYHNYVIDGINHIMRLNISTFLQKMDDPEKPIFVLGNSDDYVKISAARVYYLNMIVRYFFENKSLYKHFRLVLNRDGIKRIEEIAVVN